jgi:acyl carrier protein
MIDVNTARPVVRDVVAEMLGHSVSDSEAIVSTGLIDSLSVVRLITRLEDKLKIKLPAGHLQPEDFDTVNLIMETLEREAR